MMIAGAVLFLIGTINSFTTATPLEPTEIIIEKHIHPEFTEKLTNYGLQSGLPPFISNFMQHGTNVFFKPQFMLSPPYVAPAQEMIIESKEDCKKWPNMFPAIPFAAQPQIVLDEPVKIMETVVSGNEPPVVDKVVVIKPSAPLTDLPDQPMFISPLPEPAVNLPISSSVVFSDTPVLPPLPLIPVPVINTSTNAIPEPIPDAPELPPLEIPQAPVVLNEPVEVSMVEVMQPAVIEEIKPVPILETPELPPLPLHETLVPSLPPMPLLPVALEPEPKPEPAPYVEVYENHIPLHIPEAPELPPYSPPPLPIPVILTENLRECDKTPALVETPILIPSQTPMMEIHSEPVKVPEAPILPELVPEAVILPSNPPTLVEEVEPVIFPQPPVLPPPATTFTEIIVPQTELEPNVVEIKPVVIPPAPVLPQFDESKVPTLIEEHISKIVTTPEVPPALPVLPEVIVTPEEPTIIAEVKPAEPIAIPSPPELPPMSIPVLPSNVMISELTAPEVPLLGQTLPVLIEEPVLQSIEIPASPVLTPMVPIKFPQVSTLPAIHDSPVVIAESSPFDQEIISNVIPPAEISESVLPVAIPQAPFLPPALEMPSPVAIKEVIVSSKESKPVAKPLTIPPAPELPPLTFQPVQIPLEEPIMGLYPSAELTPVIVEEPKLPQLEISNTPMYMTFAEPPKSSLILSSSMAPAPFPIVIPHEVGVADKIASPALSQIESIISFPTTCVKNIVIERVLPNMVKEGIEVVNSPSPNYPVFSPLSSTFGIRLF